MKTILFSSVLLISAISSAATIQLSVGEQYSCPTKQPVVIACGDANADRGDRVISSGRSGQGSAAGVSDGSEAGAISSLKTTLSYLCAQKGQVLDTKSVEVTSTSCSQQAGALGRGGVLHQWTECQATGYAYCKK